MPPAKRNSKSPKRRCSPFRRTPKKGCQGSPLRSRSRSPARKRSRSPARGRSRSPARGRSRSPARRSGSRSPARRSGSRSPARRSRSRSPRPKRKLPEMKTYYVFKPNTFEVEHVFHNRQPRDAAMKAAKYFKHISVFDPNRTRNPSRTMTTFEGYMEKINFAKLKREKKDKTIALLKERNITEQPNVGKVGSVTHLTEDEVKSIVRR